jgi:hypothetical protein
MHGFVLLVGTLVTVGVPQNTDLPKVLFFANPMGSDNDVIRRTRLEVLSVAERYFSELSKGVFDVTITQDGAKVTAETLLGFKGVVFFTAINPPGVEKDGLDRVCAQRQSIRGNPFDGQHLSELSRLWRHARRVVRPSTLEVQADSSDESPREGRRWNAPGDETPGKVVRLRR